MLPQIQNLPKDQRRLLKSYLALDEKDQAVLLAFADFLKQRRDDVAVEDEPNISSGPIEIPRPAEESVVAAIKRLSSSYHMLDRSILLTKTSSLMTAHLIHGRSAIDVIDELEQLFANQYSEHMAEKGE